MVVLSTCEINLLTNEKLFYIENRDIHDLSNMSVLGGGDSLPNPPPPNNIGLKHEAHTKVESSEHIAT